ncbi:Fanconi anemia group A protein-like [Ptychodera flava]|uniref:Fanconi anemia group A protein-like n=1 Tax=Ptychodera flava TaxID=63121 RepID=UPI00396A9266
MIPKRPRLSSECEQATGRKRRKSFKELLASRRNEDQLSDTSKDMLQDAIFKLVNHQQDFNTFVSEACSENRNSASEGEVREAYSETRRDHKDFKEAELSVEGCITALQRQSSEGEVSLPVLAANTCVNKLCEMLQSRLPENSNNMILSAAERRILDTLVFLMKKLLSTQSFHRNLFVEKLNKQCPYLPLELLWQLHVSSVMPLDVFLTANVGRINVTSRFAKDMVDLHSYSTDELQLVQKILADLLSFLIVQGFPEKQHQSDKDKEDAISKGLQKASTVLLDSVVLKSFERNLQQKTEEEKNCVDVFQVIRLHSDQVPLRVLQRFVSHELSQILTHDAMVKAIEMFSKQSDTGLQIPRGLSTLFTECILILGSNDSVIQILQRIVERHDVNWQSVLSFIATFLSNFRKAGNVMNDWIRSLLQEAFEDLNKEKLTIVFLIARQASLAGTDVFPSYSQWFQSYFTNSNSSLANNKKTFTFLVEFLTEIMPYESEDWLKVHIVNPPYVIPKCKELYLDYIALAKTRIADLKSRCNPDSLSDIGLSNDNSGDAEQQKKKELMEQAQQDVDKAVTAFERNGKIPSTVMEASIFRKPYFLGRFLVALLKPRLLPDVPDTTMKFIDALRRSDKIPSSMFQNYQKACQREINALLEGVFDEDPAEADLEPLDQLKHSLDQLPGNVIKCKSDGQSWQKAHTALISVISERIQSVIGVSKSSRMWAVFLNLMLNVPVFPHQICSFLM